jgi:hypothetical protein
LENRRELDYTLIRNATDKRPRTFTELLHITKLSRKTLNSRLKEMCAEGILIKSEGMYKSNGTSGFGSDGGHHLKSLSRVFDDKKMRTGLMLVALLVSFSLSGYVLAMMYKPFTGVETTSTEPKPLDTFTMVLSVNNVNDLYSWQVAIVFNSTQVKVVNASAGDFLNPESTPPYLEYSTDTAPGLVLLTGSLEGNVPGKSGSGTLATIVFEYYANGYDPPRIVSQEANFDTWLMDSTLTMIPGGQALLTLSPTG